MLSGTARGMKYVPAHFVVEQLPHLVLSIMLGFLALTGCETMLPVSGKGNNTSWKMFIKYAHLLTGVVRDDNVDNRWAFVCSLYGFGGKNVRGIDGARHSLFVKTNRDLDELPPNHSTLKLHITRTNYQTKIWLQADQVILDLENKPTETIDLWQEGTD